MVGRGRYVEEVTSEVQSPLPGAQGARAFPTASVFKVNILMLLALFISLLSAKLNILKDLSYATDHAKSFHAY